jgi:DNA-binding NtrC family response regulator
VPDRSVDVFVAEVAKRQPLLPIVTLGSTPESVRALAWECVADAESLRPAVERAVEVGRLRRECARTDAGRHPEPAPSPLEARPEGRAKSQGGFEASTVEQTFQQGSIREMERLMILDRLKRLNENRTRSARSLDISVRTLRNKLRDYRGAAREVEKTQAELTS